LPTAFVSATDQSGLDKGLAALAAHIEGASA